MDQKHEDAGSSKDLPTPERSPTPDLGRAPGKIIGTAFPLDDFRKNTATGDLVSKAVEDLAFVITSIISKPFSAKRSDEMVECMTEMRKVSLEVSLVASKSTVFLTISQLDEIDAWNA